MKDRVSTGMSLRKALHIARYMGCRVNCRNGTGEIMISHPEIGKRVRVNGRRKDAPRSFTSFLVDVMGT